MAVGHNSSATPATSTTAFISSGRRKIFSPDHIFGEEGSWILFLSLLTVAVAGVVQTCNQTRISQARSPLAREPAGNPDGHFVEVDPGPSPNKLLVHDDRSLMFDSLVRSDDEAIAAKMKVCLRLGIRVSSQASGKV